MASERNRLFALIVALALGSLSAPDAIAGGTPTAAEKETARRLMDEGKARMKANDPPRAVEAFQKANEIMHVPTTGIALAKAHLAAGHLVEARDAALEVVRTPKDSSEPAVFETARRQARELDTQLKPRIPMLKIRVHGAAPAKVTVDDVEIATAIIGEPIAVNPGKHLVTARAADGAEAKGEIEISEREVRDIDLTFPAHDANKAPVAGAGGGSGAPSTPTSGTSGGGAKVEVKSGGLFDDRPNMVRTHVADDLILGGAIAGGVGIVAGIATGALTLSKAHAVTPQCDNNICAPAAKDDLDSALTFGTISTIAFAVGIVGCGAAVVGLLLPKKRVDAARPVMHWAPTGLAGTF